ncbi:RES superfamily protein [Flavobacterium cyanobacteriorum]|uniref:RES superfamily protein n=1 Tax=Flavobacterium cyanobacteriorum TaxID=2022802 RepID=A0A255ZZC8_9FLAO|nr:RES family NAD+ phosphorylase [Flavobacterium cyanobacteriorum]OYQ46150.1 RES superfamily protein [Flavobacterium cyanobacteriorum]
MIVYRLARAQFAGDLSGKGAEKAGGRWNSKGTAMVYTSETRALCTAEIAVHTPLGNVPLDYVLVTITIPDTVAVKEILPGELPENWRSIPHSHATQLTGDTFAEKQEYAVMKVPSAVVQGEYNYLINPSHPDSRQVTVIHSEPFTFDERLFIR